MSTEEKFHAAVNVIRSLPKNGSYQPSNELMLRFYAFFKQATLGPCKGSRPAFWDVVGRAKYDAWKKLNDMGKQEAMSNYVAELHRIVETMSYNDNVANFLEAQTELESVPIGDLELVAGDVIERVRSQPNSPFASREASPQRLRSSLETTPASSQCSPSTSPAPQDESDDEYIDTIDDFATKKTIPNGYISENIPNGHGPQTSHSRSSRSKTKTTPGFQQITPTTASTVTTDKTNSLRIDISQEVIKTIQCLKSDIERLNSKVSHLEKSTAKTSVVKKGTLFSFNNLSPSLLAFIVLWPFVTHSLLRYWSNNRK